ncbi:MAG TPA: hypothetical protein VIY48_11015 [Candidatus Paceibacterota bacterium]
MAELTEEAKAELREAMRIAREDGIHIHRTYAAFLKSQEQAPPADDKPTEGQPPPVKEETAPETKPRKRRGIGLWGTDETDES